MARWCCDGRTLSVGSMPGVLYVVKVGNAALNFNRYAPSLVSGLEG
jgi:hypothetical protein